MATITLKEGDFGGGVTVTVGETALYLPDRSRPGLNEMVPLTDIAEIESLSDDRSGQLKEAARLGMRGLFATGNPLGLAAGVLAVAKVKDVEFAVRLKDGRSFVAIGDAGTLANLRGASKVALTSTGEEAEAVARAEAVIAKYLEPGALPREPEPGAPVSSGPAAPAAGPPSPDPTPPANPQRATPLPPRPVFGRRRSG